MKLALITVLLLSAAAGAYALDLSGFFTGASPAPLKDLLVKDAPASPAPSASDLPASVKPQDALGLIASQRFIVMDIRRPEEYAAGHLEAATLRLDYYAPDFKDQLAKLDKSAAYLIYCRSGHRSGLTLAIMKDLGFSDAHDIEGGINAWQAAGLPVVK
jgi:rhodanese-related sulfurtransferase